VCGQLHAPADLPHGKSPRYTLDRGLEQVQQIMTGLQTADIEHDSFAVIMEAVYELAMQK
jgi:hypothetical protein